MNDMCCLQCFEELTDCQCLEEDVLTGNWPCTYCGENECKPNKWYCSDKCKKEAGE